MCKQERQRGEPQLVLWTLRIGDLTIGMNNPEIKAQEEGQEVMLAHAENHLMGLGEGRQHGEPLMTCPIQEQNHPTELQHREGLPLRHLSRHQGTKDY